MACDSFRNVISDIFSSLAWQQHDVQELCRVMFDALEQKFKNTEQADLISRLYEGKLKDYVKCLEVSAVLYFILF